MAAPPPNEHVGAVEPPVEEMSYTEASAELDRIVGFFEGREVDVDQLVSRLVRATAIIEELDRRLRRTRMQVDQLVPRLTSVLEETADEPEPVGPDEVGGEPEAAAAVSTTGAAVVAGRPFPGGPGGVDDGEAGEDVDDGEAGEDGNDGEDGEAGEDAEAGEGDPTPGLF